MSRLLAFPLIVAAIAACGPDIVPEPGPDTPAFQHTDGSDQVVTTIVNATSETDWLGLDLDAKAHVDAAVDAEWDLAFQRFHIRTRGGANGTGGVEVAVLPSAEFDALTEAPADGYIVDAADDKTAFESGDGWYSYDILWHKLSARPGVYVVRSDAGRFFKLQLLSYYDDAGTPAMVTFRWKELE